MKTEAKISYYHFNNFARLLFFSMCGTTQEINLSDDHILQGKHSKSMHGCFFNTFDASYCKWIDFAGYCK